MSLHYPRIRISAGFDRLMVREGLSFTFHIRRHRGETLPGVIRSLEIYLDAIGNQSLGWYSDDEGEFRELNDAGWKRIRRELLEDPFPIIQLYDDLLAERRYRFEYHGKDLEDQSRPDTRDATCAVTFWLPTEFLEANGPSRVRELALQLANPLPFSSGHGGLSFNGELDVAGVGEEVVPYCFRYPGIDLPDVHAHSWRIGTRVAGIHWLNFLGRPVLEELGGSASLLARLHSPGTTVQELDGDRALVTLSQWPEAGDIERGDNLPAYRELARVLEPWLFQHPRGLTPCIPREDASRWERRFLD
ncbi:DUF3396 domain-containing protein [Hyalangium versicolor]|uniref:DUF3396 domain-containing protein n=1 Tax=Hyalangium versicolor TaxID=2861190 RepID=UPI001CC94046|nr:DUF3396 domain-containing protein [Hyalangium versicolor]